MRFNNRVLLLGTGELERKSIIKIAFILTRAIDKKVAKTKTSFLTIGQDTW